MSDWIADLPAIVADLARRWSLRVRGGGLKLADHGLGQERVEMPTLILATGHAVPPKPGYLRAHRCQLPPGREQADRIRAALRQPAGPRQAWMMRIPGPQGQRQAQAMRQRKKRARGSGMPRCPGSP